MKLHPCKHCGGRPSLMWRVSLERNYKRTWIIKCTSCGAGVECPTERKARDAWNGKEDEK